MTYTFGSYVRATVVTLWLITLASLVGGAVVFGVIGLTLAAQVAFFTAPPSYLISELLIVAACVGTACFGVVVTFVILNNWHDFKVDFLRRHLVRRCKPQQRQWRYASSSASGFYHAETPNVDVLAKRKP